MIYFFPIFNNINDKRKMIYFMIINELDIIYLYFSNHFLRG